MRQSNKATITFNDRFPPPCTRKGQAVVVKPLKRQQPRSRWREGAETKREYNQDFYPHPNLPPAWGKELKLAAFGGYAFGPGYSPQERTRRAGASGQGAPDPLKEAEVYISFGRKAQALAILEKALKENPSRTDIQEKLQQLREGRAGVL